MLNKHIFNARFFFEFAQRGGFDGFVDMDEDIETAALRELKEMRYQWEAPYLVDSSEMQTMFDLQPTAFEAQVQATATWAQSKFSK